MLLRNNKSVGTANTNTHTSISSSYSKNKNSEMAGTSPMFKPGDDPDLFLFRLDAYIAANNKDSNTVYKNLVLYMSDDKATQWVMEQPNAVRADKETLIQKFKAKFNTKDAGRSMSVLRNKRQTRGEDPESFIEDMARLCQQVGMPESASVPFIVESLIPELQFIIKIKNPSKMDELIEAVRTCPPQTATVSSDSKLDRIQEQLSTLVVSMNSTVDAIKEGATNRRPQTYARQSHRQTTQRQCGRCGGKFCSNYRKCKAIG